MANPYTNHASNQPITTKEPSNLLVEELCQYEKYQGKHIDHIDKTIKIISLDQDKTIFDLFASNDVTDEEEDDL